jgi:hypothetical protein
MILEELPDDCPGVLKCAIVNEMQLLYRADIDEIG